MRRSVTSNSLPKWSSIFNYFYVFSVLDHVDAMKVRVSPNALAESHSICSAAGAIYVEKTFTQSNSTMSIINSSAELEGGAVHLGAPIWGSFEMLLEQA